MFESASPVAASGQIVLAADIKETRLAENDVELRVTAR